MMPGIIAKVDPHLLRSNLRHMARMIDIDASKSETVNKLNASDLHDHFSFTERSTPCAPVPC